MSAVVAVASVATVALAASLVVRLAPAQAADPVSTTFVHTGAAQSFVVPAGVTSIHVVAIGGKGATITSNPGGPGGRAEAVVPVTAGQTLTVRVGGNGGLNNNNGAFNGGGGGQVGGGGASDIRTVAGDLQTRLVTAGGGGGSGSTSGGAAGNDGDGGGSDCAGKGATATTPGAGGGDPGSPAVPGSLGQGGGDQGQGYGGGGGGGVYGGGQGAWFQAYDPISDTYGIGSCGGGGGSSGFGPGIAGTKSIDNTGVPKVVITYTVGTPPTEPTSTTTTTTTTTTPTTTATTTSATATTETTTATTTTTTTMTPTATAPSITPAPPALVSLKAPRRQVGTAVKATAQVGVAGSAVTARLTVKPKAGKALKLGQLTRSGAPAGSLAMNVKLNRKGKSLLKQAGKLTVSLTVTGTPTTGSPVTISKPVTLRAG